MMRLVRLGDGDGEPDARAIVTRAEIGEEGWPVAQALARERLLALGARAKAGAEGAETEETAEIAHEALLTGWKKLAGWTRSDRDFGRWRQRLAVYLGSWSGEPQDADLPAPQLGETTSWLERRREDLNQNECAFIKAARENAEREAARLKSRLRLLVLAVVMPNRSLELGRVRTGQPLPNEVLKLGNFRRVLS